MRLFFWESINKIALYISLNSETSRAWERYHTMLKFIYDSLIFWGGIAKHMLFFHWNYSGSLIPWTPLDNKIYGGGWMSGSQCHRDSPGGYTRPCTGPTVLSVFRRHGSHFWFASATSGLVWEVFWGRDRPVAKRDFCCLRTSPGCDRKAWLQTGNDFQFDMRGLVRPGKADKLLYRKA